MKFDNVAFASEEAAQAAAVGLTDEDRAEIKRMRKRLKAIAERIWPDSLTAMDKAGFYERGNTMAALDMARRALKLALQ